MASIKGIELKGVKEFLGHEQETLLQASVYYKGKKIGFWSQDAWGGCDNFDIDYKLGKELVREIKDITDNYIGNVMFKGIDDLYSMKYNFVSNFTPKGYEYFFMDLVELYEQEKKYKKYAKKWGIPTIAICYRSLFDTTIRGTNRTKEDFEKQLGKDKELKLFYVYDSLNDFVR